jgi:transcription elongation factor GreA
MANKKTLLTQEGLREVQEELRILKEVTRVEIAEKLKEAISFGDLSENAEYEAARSEQAQIELRITDLEEILKDYEIIDSVKEGKKKKNTVSIGNTVSLEIHRGDEIIQEDMKIVGSMEADVNEGKISNESPLGLAILNREVGDTVTVKSPGGQFTVKIIALK